MRGEGEPLGLAVWADTRIALPEPCHGRTLRQVLTGVEMPVAMGEGQPSLAVAEALGHFPVALLETG